MTVSAVPQSDPAKAEGFFVAAFSAFGHFEGIGWWEYRNLSEKWTKLCADLLEYKGPVFDHRWSGPLSHIRTKLTSAEGAGICTVFVGDTTASSILLMRGSTKETEDAIAKMYIESLERSVPRDWQAACGVRFSELNSVSDRPVMVVVPFGSGVSEQDQDLVRELGWHMAAAFFQNLDHQSR